MAIFIENILDVHSITAISEALESSALFEDGKKTAGNTAKKVKKNLQAKSDHSLIQGAIKKIELALLANRDFQNAALPREFVKIMFSRYEAGMYYDNHIDDAFIKGIRTDLSFTLFLCEPDSYTGGELVICKPDGEESIKAPKGTLYLYPTDSIHRVEPVTSGIRLVAVGWLQSKVRHDAQRNILINLDYAINQLADTPENHDARLRLLQSKNNLLRMWSD